MVAGLRMEVVKVAAKAERVAGEARAGRARASAVSAVRGAAMAAGCVVVVSGEAYREPCRDLMLVANGCVLRSELASVIPDGCLPLSRMGFGDSLWTYHRTRNTSTSVDASPFMQTSRNAIRQVCRQVNAYDVALALKAAFGTAARQSQQETARPGRRLPGNGAGSYASFDAISESLGGGRQGLGHNGSNLAAPQSYDLLKRQRALEQQRAREEDQSSSMDIGRLRRVVPRDRSRRKRSNDPPRRRPEHTVSEREASAPKSPPPSKDVEASWKVHMQEIAQAANEMAKNVDFAVIEPEKLAEYRRALDYDAKPLDLQSSDAKGSSSAPWAREADERVRIIPLVALDEEILRFASWAEPTFKEKAARSAVVDQTQAFIRKNFHTDQLYTTNLFGSGATGLSTIESDIDIRISGDKPTAKFQGLQGLAHRLGRLCTAFGRSPDYTAATFRWSAFPIINVQHRATGLDIQIVVAPPTVEQQVVTAHYLASIPNLRELFLLLRTTFSARHFLDVYNGGLGSYPLFIMLVGSLLRAQQSSTPPRSPSEQLLHFLSFYGDFPYSTRGLSLAAPSADKPTRPAKLFPKHPSTTLPPATRATYIRRAFARQDRVRAGQYAIGAQKPAQPYLFCLQDPADPKNDLGRKTNGIKYFAETCRDLAKTLKAKLDQGLVDGNLLEGVVGDWHEVARERREKLEAFGSEVLARKQRDEAQEVACRREWAERQKRKTA